MQKSKQLGGSCISFARESERLDKVNDNGQGAYKDTPEENKLVWTKDLGAWKDTDILGQQGEDRNGEKEKAVSSPLK